ncbi:MAG: phenazine biosynthesis protein PhzF, partial [Pseudonocardiaceae bacterium]
LRPRSGAAAARELRRGVPPGARDDEPRPAGDLRDTGQVVSGRLTLWQGEDMGRPSELLVDVDPADGRVRVSGAAARIDGART